MAEFVFQLLVRQEKKGERFHGCDFLRVEMVAPAEGFVINGFQVGVQRLKRMGSFPETVELGMMDVAFGLAGEHFPGQQTFPPQGDQSGGIQI
jgi:hypothetical protein